MRTISSRRQLYFAVTAIVLLASACSLRPADGPESGAKVTFEEWALQASVPYKDVSYQVMESDDSFATVRVVATLRESATQDWLEKQADIECRQVGGQWQCSLAFTFSLTEAEEIKQRQIAASTATATALASPKMQEVAAGKPTIALGFWRYSSSYSFPSSGIVDGRTNELHCTIGIEGGNTYWLLPDRQAGWVQVDLQQPYKIVKLRWLNTHNGGCGDRATTEFHIALSQTGAFAGEEKVVYNGVMSFSASPQFKEFTLSEPVQAQYVRFYVDGYYREGGGLNELEVYAEAAIP